jgi:hypothetical protein
MSSVVIAGDTSGSITLDAPAVAGTTTLTLPATSGTVMVNGAAFLVSRTTTSQSISLNTYTKVQFNNVIFDTDSDWDAANYRFIPSVAGYYQFNLNVTSASSGVSAVFTTIWKNGAETAWATIQTSGGRSTPTVSVVLYMNGTTDYVEGYGFIEAGTSPVFQSSTTLRTSFSGCLVRGA